MIRRVAVARAGAGAGAGWSLCQYASNTFTESPISGWLDPTSGVSSTAGCQPACRVLHVQVTERSKVVRVMIQRETMAIRTAIFIDSSLTFSSGQRTPPNRDHRRTRWCPVIGGQWSVVTAPDGRVQQSRLVTANNRHYRFPLTTYCSCSRLLSVQFQLAHGWPDRQRDKVVSSGQWSVVTAPDGRVQQSRLVTANNRHYRLPLTTYCSCSRLFSVQFQLAHGWPDRQRDKVVSSGQWSVVTAPDGRVQQSRLVTANNRHYRFPLTTYCSCSRLLSVQFQLAHGWPDRQRDKVVSSGQWSLLQTVEFNSPDSSQPTIDITGSRLLLTAPAPAYSRYSSSWHKFTAEFYKDNVNRLTDIS
ncbi:hypothetical protein J6590_002460 [Homalodisca vitripennis]|nr:hypothetical protein J6590_002460 [Homalodisca vitripennis]